MPGVEGLRGPAHVDDFPPGTTLIIGCPREGAAVPGLRGFTGVGARILGSTSLRGQKALIAPFCNTMMRSTD